jgi:predicted DNA-binding protein (MmcQ/YjbR family)
MHPQTKPTAAIAKQFESLRKHGLGYPEAHEDHPWGHSALKVKGKAFAFLWADGEGMTISVKLPESNALALNLPFAEPTGYGLGKSGWVTAKFGNKDKAPLDVLYAWMEESFRAVAPKKLVAAWAQGGGGEAKKAANSAKKPPAKKGVVAKKKGVAKKRSGLRAKG